MVNIFRYILLFVEILSCILLVGAILIQKSKGQGIGGLAFGVGMGESLFGSGASNVLTRATVILAIVFLANTTLLALIGSVRSAPRSVLDSTPAQTVPAQPVTRGAGEPAEGSWGVPDDLQGAGEGASVPQERGEIEAPPADSDPMPE
ncbi:MAG: preprotein translocase subunit SecG [Kiritimatiellia bacterium]